MNPDAHSVHMAVRAVVVYLFTNITPKGPVYTINVFIDQTE